MPKFKILDYDELISQGNKANKATKGRLAKKKEKKLLNRLVKYKANHLLFLYDFRVHYSNNMSEKTCGYVRIRIRW